MAIRMECPGCQSKLTIPEELQGKQVRCPKCSKLTLVPGGAGKAPARGDNAGKSSPASSSGAASSAAGPKPSAKPSEAVTKGPPPERAVGAASRSSKKARADEDDEERSSPKARRTRRDYRDEEDSEDRPKRRKGQDKSALPWILAGVGGGVVLAAAIIVALIMSGSETKPQEVVVQNDPPRRKNPPIRQPGQVLAIQRPNNPQLPAPPQQVEVPPGPAPKEIEKETTNKVKKATAYVRVKLGNGKVVSGSGFFAAEKGLVFTNAHVLGMLNPSSPPPSKVEIVAHSGEPGEFIRPGRVLGADRESDLAVLRIDGDGSGLPDPLPVDSTRSLTELQEVYVFGFPFGESLGKNITINRSAVSSLRRAPDGTVYQVQLNGGMNPGNSGGPVVDSRGVVIGVAVSHILYTQIAFAVPGERVQGMLWGRVAEVSVGEAYLKDGLTRLPIEMNCLDPMNRLESVKVDVWAAGAGSGHGNQPAVRPPSLLKPAALPGDGPRQTTNLVYQNNKAACEIDVPAMNDSQTLWLQPVVTDKAGRTLWATAMAFKMSEHVPVERKSAVLQYQVEREPERTIKVKGSNKVLVYERKKQESISFNLESEALEVAQKDPQGSLYRLTLGETKFALEVNDKAVPHDSKAQALFKGKFVQFVTGPTGDLVTRGQTSLNASSAPNVRAEFDAKLNQLANSYEMTCISLPGREVQPKESWPTKVPILLGGSTRKEEFDMHLVCTMEGIRQARAGANLGTPARRASEGQTLAVITVRGSLKARKPGGLVGLAGNVTGKAFFAVDRGYLAHAQLKVDCEVDFDDQTLASYIMDVDLTRVPGNTASIVPSKDTPPPIVAKGKTIFQVPTATLGPGDPINYPGRLAIPYKFWPIPFVGGKTYVIEMNKVGTDSIDPYLILHNPQNVKVAEDDDSGGDLNARIVFQAPATGIYGVFATTLMINQGGNFQFIVSEAAADPKNLKPDSKKSDQKKTDQKKGLPKGQKPGQGEKVGPVKGSQAWLRPGPHANLTGAVQAFRFEVDDSVRPLPIATMKQTFDFGQDGQNNQRQGRAQDGGCLLSQPGSHAHGGGHSDAGRRGEAAHLALLRQFQDRAGSDKADAGDQALDDAAQVRAGHAVLFGDGDE